MSEFLVKIKLRLAIFALLLSETQSREWGRVHVRVPYRRSYWQVEVFSSGSILEDWTGIWWLVSVWKSSRAAKIRPYPMASPAWSPEGVSKFFINNFFKVQKIFEFSPMTRIELKLWIGAFHDLYLWFMQKNFLKNFGKFFPSGAYS